MSRKLICGIYEITNTINLKKYIGQSIDVEKRLKQHKNKLSKGFHPNIYLQRSWNINGSESFKFNLLEICRIEELSEKEIAYIEKFQEINKSFNLTSGGEGSLGRVVSEETRAKLSKSSKGRKPSSETIEKIRKANSGKKNSFYGKTHSIESKKKISEAHKNMEMPWLHKPLPEEVKRKISESNMGKKAWNKGKPHNEETRNKISKTLTGRKLSEDVKRKIKESTKDINRKITYEDEMKIFSLYEKGINRVEVMNKFHISQTTFYRVVRKHKTV